jgi:SHS2 domain-containing protein
VARFFRELDHVGDLAIEVTGRSRVELFAHALVALARLMVEAPGLRTTDRRQFDCEAEDDPALMHDILSRALNLFLIDSFIWCRATVEEKGRGLKITLFGEQYDRTRHQLLREIKGVTFHQLFAGRGDDGWRAKIIFDV